MSDSEMLDAYHRALHAYDAAKAGWGDRVRTFVQFMSAETALANRVGREVFRKQFHDLRPD